MTALAIRQRLFEYIRFADEKKIKAIYTIVEEEIKEKHNIWTREFETEMGRRARDLENGKVSPRSWEEVQKKAAAILRKKRK
ncbi:MAG TPA: hypothetical protein VNZ49_10245 [Bacteroidia bacterium]|jgi:hypothetical protein|nr:hypothetical protein [Bacteroidia bacterium]